MGIKIIRTGITRTVIVFDSFVVKVPNIRYGYRNFLRAILCNIDEGNLWNMYQPEIRDEFLCPVMWHTKTGLLLIMKRADTEKHQKEMNEMQPCYNCSESYNGFYNRFIKAGFGGDDKPDNYGYYKNRLVKIDYSL